jgi:DNA-binding transcriptional ArsR family regulator
MLTTEHAVAEAPGDVLADLLFGAYRHRVLSLLLLRPGDSFHVRMIARLTGVPAGSLHRELRLLAYAGLLSAERQGNQIRYSANQASPVFEELAAVLEKTAGAPPLLQDHSEEHSIEVPDRPKRSRARARRRDG